MALTLDREELQPRMDQSFTPNFYLSGTGNEPRTCLKPVVAYQTNTLLPSVCHEPQALGEAARLDRYYRFVPFSHAFESETGCC